MRRAAIASLSVALFLTLIKFAAFLMTNSISMLAALADSSLDVFAALLNMWAIRSALTPPDREHRFGHGKAEPLAGLGQSAFIFGSATFLSIEAFSRLLDPHPLQNEMVGLITMAISIILTIALITYQRRVIARTQSLAIKSDSAHYLSDVAANLGVVLSLLLVSYLGWHWADPVIALLIAAWLCKSAFGVLREAYDQLMDREFPEADRQRIKSIVLSNLEIRDLHELRTRSAGIHHFIQCHITLAPDISLRRAHEISDAVEAELRSAFPHADVIIHQDPEGLIHAPDSNIPTSAFPHSYRS